MSASKQFECPVESCPYLENNAAYMRGYLLGLATNKNWTSQQAMYDAGFKAGAASIDTLKHYTDGLKAGINSVDTSAIYSAAYASALRNLDERTSQNKTEQAYAEGYNKGFKDGKDSVNKEYIQLLYSSMLNDSAVAKKQSISTNFLSQSFFST